VIEPDRPHTARRPVPDVGVPDLWMIPGQLHFIVDMDFMAGTEVKPVLFAKTGLFGVRGDFADPIAEKFGLSFDILKVFSSKNFETDIIKTGPVGLAKHYAVMIKFIIGLEHNTAITGTAYFIKAKNIGVKLKGFVQVHNAKLNKTRTNGIMKCHSCTSVVGMTKLIIILLVFE